MKKENLMAAANMFNVQAEESGLPYRASAKMVWLDLGAGWKDWTIVVRDLTEEKDSCTATFQVGSKERDLCSDRLTVEEGVLSLYNIVLAKWQKRLESLTKRVK